MPGQRCGADWWLPGRTLKWEKKSDVAWDMTRILRVFVAQVTHMGYEVWVILLNIYAHRVRNSYNI